MQATWLAADPLASQGLLCTAELIMMYIKASELKFCRYSVRSKQIILLVTDTYARW
jgi:hypothetical protein